MSRSYRKNPYATDGQDKKFRKNTRRFYRQQANQKVRNSKDVGDGASYKRHYQSWNICDWKFYSPKTHKRK